MIYILLFLLVVLILLIIYLIYLISTNSNKNYESLFKILSENSNTIGQNLLNFKNSVDDSIINALINSNKNVTDIGNRVQDKLTEGLKSSNDTLNKLIEKLAQIDRTQNNIENLSKSIENFQKILDNKNQRGLFGEAQLYQTLDYVYGNTNLYEKQHQLSNGSRVDAIVYISTKKSKLSIDSKFPLDNYLKYLEDSSLENRKLFIQGVKKQIDDISKKYIIEGETLSQALMFIPSESIYIDIYTNFSNEILQYAISKNIWIVSRYSLLIYISTIQAAEINNYRNENAKEILEELIKFSDDFERYKIRWDNIVKDINKLVNDARDINITSDKIYNKFIKIKNKETK